MPNKRLHSYALKTKKSYTIVLNKRYMDGKIKYQFFTMRTKIYGNGYGGINKIFRQKFTIEIAGIPIGIESRFGSTKQLYRDYLTKRLPWKTVSVSDAEMKLEGQATPEEDEQLCIYRKIALLMMDYDAFLMHAAIINIDGQGIAFTAESGTGKTTRVMLWQKAFGKRMKVVNGDKPMMRFMNDDLYAYGTPWRGKERMGENTSVPMKAVCFIQRGETVSLQRMDAKDITKKLFKQVLVPNNPMLMGQFMTLMERFVQEVPFYLYTCNMYKEEPEKLWEQIQAEQEVQYAV